MSSEPLAHEWNQVAQCLRDWPSEIPSGLETPHLRRLAACLSATSTHPSTVGSADLAVVIRQALRVGIEPPSVQRNAARLTVPADDAGHPWLSVAQWATFGVNAHRREDGRLALTANPWAPAWLSSSDGVDTSVASAPHDEGRRRVADEVPADLFLRATFPRAAFDLSTYTSDAHRQAVRTVLASQPGATIFVNLPTGAGKSTVAIAPAFSRSTPTGVSLMVVPTVALALDQERRVRHKLLGGSTDPFAYTGSTPPEVRYLLRQRIRNGIQPILFVSPEAITHSLAPAVFAAARAGHLRYFIIDEAHLVDQWGTEFRPEFQTLPGLRLELLNEQRKAGFDEFRTLLMTATMSPSTADLLHNLFGKPGPVEVAVDNTLRREPSYWSAEFAGRERRSEGVVEAVHHLPRPAIVYSSRPAYAEVLYKQLRAAGYKRLELFTGETSDAERRRILNAFRDDAIDLVVATSAFGLGVDQDDIRTIVHACIPETIDRYYQEVGRSGRDGRASISVVCWTDGDKIDARSFSHPRLIDEELGLKRWNTMLLAATRKGGRLALPMASLRPGLERLSEQNEKWNLRTLGLLIRAGLLRSGWDMEDRYATEETPKDDTSELGEDAAGRYMIVDLSEGAINDSVWAKRVAPVRARAIRENDRAYNMMLDALKPGATICTLIQQAYDLGPSTEFTDLPNRGRPALFCGGCPAHPAGYVAGVSPLLPPVRHPVAIAHGRSHRLLWPGTVPLVTYRAPSTARKWEAFGEQLAELVRVLVGDGLRIVLTTPRFLNLPQLTSVLSEIHLVTRERMFFTHLVDRFETLELERIPMLPTAVVAAPGVPLPEDWFTPESDSLGLALVIPNDLRAPQRPDRALVDLYPEARDIEDILETWSE